MTWHWWEKHQREISSDSCPQPQRSPSEAPGSEDSQERAAFLRFRTSRHLVQPTQPWHWLLAAAGQTSDLSPRSVSLDSEGNSRASCRGRRAAESRMSLRGAVRNYWLHWILTFPLTTHHWLSPVSGWGDTCSPCRTVILSTACFPHTRPCARVYLLHLRLSLRGVLVPSCKWGARLREKRRTSLTVTRGRTRISTWVLTRTARLLPAPTL